MENIYTHGYYYLHSESKDLIYKKKIGGNQVAEFQESDFVTMFWSFRTDNRSSAWRVLIEASVAGAKDERIEELAKKWNCDNADAKNYAEYLGLILKMDGNAYCVHAKNFRNMQQDPCGFGETALEAMIVYCKELGYEPKKMWGHSFHDLVAIKNSWKEAERMETEEKAFKKSKDK